MDHIRAIVADDAKPDRGRVMALLEGESDVELVGVGHDGRHACELIRAENPHLAILDVDLPGLSGIDIVHKITPAQMPATIFMARTADQALRAFDVHAVDYLVKPFTNERFASALEHARRFLRGLAGTEPRESVSEALGSAGSNGHGHLERVVIRTSGRVTFLPVTDIDWIEAAGVYINLHVGPRAHLYRSSVANFLGRLDPRHFVRIHRSAVVNTERIRELHPRSHGDYTIVLKDGRELTLSRAYRSELERWLRQPL